MLLIAVGGIEPTIAGTAVWHLGSLVSSRGFKSAGVVNRDLRVLSCGKNARERRFARKSCSQGRSMLSERRTRGLVTYLVRSPGVARILCARAKTPQSPNVNIRTKTTISQPFYHLLPRIGPPFDRISSAHLLGISAIRCRISSSVILSYSSCIPCFISSSESKILRLNLCFIMFQIPSIGFKSGLWAGCLRFLML